MHKHNLIPDCPIACMEVGKFDLERRSRCQIWCKSSQKVVDEYSWHHDDNARYTEVGEAVCMRSPEELPTAVGVKYAPEQSSQWSYQGL